MIVYRSLALATNLALLGGCASAPSNTQLTAHEWRQLSPLAVEFTVHVPDRLVAYEPMGDSATLGMLVGVASGGEGLGLLLVPLLLPVFVPIDAGRLVAENIREARAEKVNARIADGWQALLEPERYRRAFEAGVRAAVPALVVDDGSRPRARAEQLTADLHVMLHPDARALLSRVTLRYPGVENSVWSFDVPRFATRLYFHSDPLPTPLAIRHNRRLLDSGNCLHVACTWVFTRDAVGELPDRDRKRIDWSDAELRHLYVALWLENDARRLRDAFAQAAASTERLTRHAFAAHAPTGQEDMTLGRLFFPYLYADDVRFDTVARESGRLVLRSRAEPTRRRDRRAALWYDIPVADRERRAAYTDALLAVDQNLGSLYP